MRPRPYITGTTIVADGGVTASSERSTPPPPTPRRIAGSARPSPARRRAAGRRGRARLRAEPDPHVRRAAAVRRLRGRPARGDHRRRAVRGPRPRPATRRSRSSSPARSASTARHGYGCVGSLAGVYTASMPVFVVENPPFGNTAFCNFYEGKERRRLNYGCYDDGVHERLEHVNEVLGPVVGEAVRAAGGIELLPIMRRAAADGRRAATRARAAATMLFEEALALPLLDLAADDRPACARCTRRSRATTTTSCGSRWRPARRPATRRTASRARPSSRR